jgi:hypothetical protein
VTKEQINGFQSSLAVGFQWRTFSFSEVPNCPRPQLPVSHFLQVQLSTEAEVEVEVTFRLTASLSVRLGIEPTVGFATRY